MRRRYVQEFVRRVKTVVWNDLQHMRVNSAVACSLVGMLLGFAAVLT